MEIIMPRRSKKEILDSSPVLRPSLNDGVAHATMLGLGDTYLNPFAVSLHASFYQLGLLASLPTFFGAWCQLGSVWGLQFLKSRRRALVVGAICNASSWILMSLLAFSSSFFDIGVSSSMNALLLLTILYAISTGWIVPLWSGLVGELIPKNVRSEYLGLRSSFIAIATFLGMLLGGQILSFFSHHQSANIGFGIIFLLAGIARGISAYYLSRYEDPVFTMNREHAFSLWSFLKKTPNSNFARFVFFGGGIAFAHSIMNPFFSLFLLNERGISYFNFTLISASAVMIQFFTLQSWGRLLSFLGNKRILHFCGYGLCFTPFFWIITSSTFAAILIQMYSGFVWAGYNLATSTFLFDAVSKQKLARCAAYQAIVNTTCLCAGSLVGALLGKYLQSTTINHHVPYIGLTALETIFFISGCMRLIAARIMLPKFDEVRNLKPIDRDLFFEVTSVRPLAELSFKLFSSIPVKRYQPEEKKVE
jgi:MFS family permease